MEKVTVTEVARARSEMQAGRVGNPITNRTTQPEQTAYQRALELDKGDSAGEKYVTYNDWLQSGTEEESKRRRLLLSRIDQAEKEVTREAYTGQRKLTGTVAEMADAVLEQEGYSPEEIAQARKMTEYYEGMGLYDAGRRTGQTVAGTATTIASFVPQAIDYTKQRIKNIINTEQARVEELEALGMDAVTALDEETGERRFLSPEQTLQDTADREQALIDAQEPVSQDTFGYKLYQSGQERLEDAMRGESEGQRFVHSAITSAGENLALAAINPALVLPVLTVQGAADNLAEATSGGRDIGRTVAGTAAKAGIGWIIEEAGVAQMAQNMGRKFAASALSENILNFMRSAPGMEALQQGAPMLYGILASGTDEAVEEFVESYADKLVDVALGDADPGELLSLEQLAEAGMGAAGGALGGAMIGGASTGIGMLSGAYNAGRAGNSGPVELAPEAPAAQTQQGAQASQTQTPASAALSEDLSALQAAVAPAAAPDTGAAAAAQQATAEPQQAAQAQQTAPVQNQEWSAPPSVGQDGQLGADAWEQLAARQAALRAQQETANPGAPLTEQTRGQESVDAAPAAMETQPAQQIRQVEESSYWTREQRQEARLLAENSSMTPEAVELVVDAMPQDISGEVYTPAARMIYQIARQGLAETEAEALTLAGKSGAMVPQVMAVPGGAEALHQAWNQGRIEGLAASGYGQAGLAAAETAGTVTVEEGAFLPEEDRVLLDLSAAASDTAVTVREKLENNAGGYVDTALGQIYFAAEEGQDTFGTVLHEQTHLYNALDPEGGRILQTNVLKALAESQGYEQVDSLIQSYIQRYQEAGQPISYAQACEEVAADAWRGIFGSKESFVRWVKRQVAQAKKNAESRGTIRKMMDTVKGILDNIIQRAKQILAREPENTAARWAMELAENQKRALEEEYYRHQDAALEVQRTARQGGQTAANQAVERTGQRAAQLREGESPAQERTAEERLTEKSSRKTKAPQAGWTGKGDAAYDTLAALPDMKITPIDTRAVEGKNYREIVADAFENMGAGREATKATVTNRYTGMEITVRRQSIERSFNAGRQIKTRGPYVEQIGSILENAVKVNELEPRSNELRSDIYLGAAENEKGELVGVRLIVNVYENGRAELDTASLEDEVGRLYAHLGTKIGDAEASPIGAPAFEAGGHAVSRSPLQGPRASTAEAEPSHTISIADLMGAVNKTVREEGRRNVVNWLEGVLSEDVRQHLESAVPKSADVARDLRYQLPVDDTPTESGQKMAAWENVDRAEVEQALTKIYQEKKFRRVPVENIRGIARRLLRGEGSKANQITVAKKLENFMNWLAQGGDFDTAMEVAGDIADTVMQGSSRKDTTLYDQYPDLHRQTLYVKRGGTEYKEVVSQYGKFGIAQKELAKYGITLTTSEAKSDFAIDKVYKTLTSEYGEMFPAEVYTPSDKLDVIADRMAMIRPTVVNDYGENYDEYKADLAMRILGMAVAEGVTDQSAAGMLRQRIDENLNRHRAGIQERVANNLNRLERDAKRNKQKAEALARMNRNQRVALAGSMEQTRRARDARSADATRRAIAANASKITQMLKNPSKNGYFPVSMMNDALTIAKIANTATYNKKAIEDLQKMETRFKKYLEGDGSESDISLDFQQSGIMEMLENLRTSMEMRQQRNARLEQQADDAARLFERGLNQMYDRQSEQEIMAEAAEGAEAGRLDRMSIAQLNTVRDLTSAILTTARNANRLMTIRKAQAASEIAYQAAEEVRNSPYKLEDKDGILKNFQKGAEFVNENVLNARRLFAVLSGYSHGGAMEAVSEALIAGETKRNRIMVEGAKEFLNVMEGKENQKKYKKFSGTGAKLVTVDAFVDADGKPAQMTEAMADTLLLHLENAHNAENALLGGITIPDMKEYVKGNLKEAKRKGKLYRCKFELKSKEDYLAALPKAKASVEGALSDYAKTWAETSRGFLNGFTKDLINQTSMMMHGYKKATEENYVTLRVDPDVLEQKNEGVVRNSTIEGRGFLKNRNQYAINPILLEEIDQVVMRSLKDTADYAGLAPAIRDFNMVWNANRKEGGSLAATVGREFGDGAVKFVKEYLTDLQQPRQSDKNLVTVLGGALRTGLARGVLPLNVRVALGQISGVFGYGSELGVKGTAAAVEYMMTWHGKEGDAAIRQEMMDWGYYGLESTLSDGPTTEIAERRSRKNTLERVSDKLGLGNVLELMDKKTREAGWIGCKIYVQENLEEYGLTEADVETQSDKYKAAVVSKMTRATENTQPNYTVSQLAAIQRSPDQMAKLFTMFKTQAFQNYGIAQYAIGDYRAQQLRLKAAEQQAADQSLSAEQRQQAEENLSKARKEATAAKQRLFMAAGGLASQGLVYSMIRRLIDFIFYKEDDDLRDEDGEITPGSVAMTIGFDTLKAATTDNVFLLPEAMAVLGNIVGIRNTEPVSLPGVDSLGDLSSSLLSFYSYWTDTAESAEKALSDAEIDSLWEALTDIKGTVSALKNGGISVSEAIDKTTDLAGNVFMMMGAPVSNVKRLVEGVLGWGQDIYKALTTEGIDLGDVINTPTSSSQYDDLYTAVFETENPEDAAEALAALEKLDKLNPPAKPGDAKAGDTKILSELLKREKEFGSLIQDAAAARVNGDSKAQEKAMGQLVDTLAGALGIDKNTSAGRRRLTTVINKVNDAISEEMKKQMGADSKTGATIYTPVLNALETGSGLAEAQAVLRRAGITDEDIRSAVVSAYKEDYLYSDEAGRKAIEGKLLRLKDADGEAYFAEKDFSGWIVDWELKGFNDSVYTDLDEALQTRNQITAQEEIYRYMEAGKSAGSIRERITALFKEEYLKANQAQRQEIAKFLVRLRGPKGEKLVTVDTLTGWIKDEAKKKAGR